MTTHALTRAVEDCRKLLGRLETIAAGCDLPKDSRLYGVKEAAGALGIESRTLSGYLNRGQCPEPYARLASGPVWTEKQIEAWKEVRR